MYRQGQHMEGIQVLEDRCGELASGVIAVPNPVSLLQRGPGTTTNRQQRRSNGVVDDFTAWVTGKTARDNRECIESIIRDAVAWEKRSGTTFEAEKTAIIDFIRNDGKS
ncbi:hypothetical protein CSUB01_08026 [Colletotrichum sublineola]|uniref:Uncharacterized protein n=1 Tax=Colletotrichum sublineola TaxID=1173701 RepID=A0A066X1W4_COLSU|nr:hypothetical protein CSUB01_08026 [Colletotrichum sublineola]